jgi:hypothetical protein
MRDEEAYGFYLVVDKQFAKCAEPLFASSYMIFTDRLEAYTLALEPPRKSLLTPLIAAAQRRRVAASGGISARVRLALSHVDPEKAFAARRLNAIIKSYKSPRLLEYVECTGVVHNIIDDLDTPTNRALLRQVDAEEWLDELKAASMEFDTLYLARQREERPPKGLVRDARAAVGKAYANCVTRLNALVELNGATKYASLVEPINTLIHNKKNLYRVRQGKKEKLSEREERKEYLASLFGKMFSSPPADTSPDAAPPADAGTPPNITPPAPAAAEALSNITPADSKEDTKSSPRKRVARIRGHKSIPRDHPKRARGHKRAPRVRPDVGAFLELSRREPPDDEADDENTPIAPAADEPLPDDISLELTDNEAGVDDLPPEPADGAGEEDSPRDEAAPDGGDNEE